MTTIYIDFTAKNCVDCLAELVAIIG